MMFTFPEIDFKFGKFQNFKIIKIAKKSTFYVKNPNFEHIFVSSTLKVEETKVPPELGFF